MKLQEIKSTSATSNSISANLAQAMVTNTEIRIENSEYENITSIEATSHGGSCPSDLSGQWHGDDEWGPVELSALNGKNYRGTYSQTWGTQDKGLMTLSTEIKNGICMGSGIWGEGNVSAGNLFDLRIANNGRSIKGYWSRTIHFQNQFIKQRAFEWIKK